MLQNAEISKNFWRKIKRTGGGFTAAPAPLIIGCAVALIDLQIEYKKDFFTKFYCTFTLILFYGRRTTPHKIK